jgi:hypothetical protein
VLRQKREENKRGSPFAGWIRLPVTFKAIEHLRSNGAAATPTSCWGNTMSAERYSHSWIDFGPAFESGQDDDGPVCDVPPWLAMVIVALEPGLDDDKGSEFLAGVTDKARRWPALDDAAWRRILVFFATECIQFTLDIAAPLQSDATQIEWDETYAACTSVLAALRGETDFAAAAVTAQYAANNLEPEVVSTNQRFMMVSADTTWAMKCAADTANWVGEALLKDSTLIVYAVKIALSVRRTKKPHRFLGQHLASMISTEFAAAKGWSPPLSFS